MKVAFQTAVLLLFLGTAAGHAEEPSKAATPWTGTSPAQTRLILETAEFSGESVNRAGVQIKLDAGWWTYWRAPGASGMPPMFDWSGSENLADDPETIWPVPLRAVEYGESLNLYRDEVVFPIEFRAADPAKPVKLHLQVVFGVCRNMCVPISAKHEFTLKPAAGTPQIVEQNAELIAAYSGRRPSHDPLAAGMAIGEVRAGVLSGKVILTIRARGIEGKGRTLVLVEGPGFTRVAELAPSSVDDNNVALLKLTIGDAFQFRALKGKRIQITLIHGGRALEQTWVVGAEGSSVSGLGLTPLAGPTERPEP